MSLYNISSNTEYDIPKATWNTGNDREDILIKPRFGVSDYVSCIFDISLIYIRFDNKCENFKFLL